PGPRASPADLLIAVAVGVLVLLPPARRGTGERQVALLVDQDAAVELGLPLGSEEVVVGPEGPARVGHVALLVDQPVVARVLDLAVRPLLARDDLLARVARHIRRVLLAGLAHERRGMTEREHLALRDELVRGGVGPLGGLSDPHRPQAVAPVAPDGGIPG